MEEEEEEEEEEKEEEEEEEEEIERYSEVAEDACSRSGVDSDLGVTNVQ